MPSPPLGRRAATRARGLSSRAHARGMTLIELLVVTAVVSLAIGMLASIVRSFANQRLVNRETAIAAEAARTAIERMVAADSSRLFALYNAAPADDPGGAGTAPGSLFAVRGLTAPGGGNVCGEISFPALARPEAPVPALREDFEDHRLGMPRDLNGDSIVDDDDHAADYLVLPVRVRVRWEGPTGVREYELFTILGNMEERR